MTTTREIQGTVTTETRAGGVTTSTHMDTTPLGLARFDGPAVEVGVSLGRTVALGNFEFVRIDVSIKAPCPADDEAARVMFDRALAWTEKRLTREVEKVTPPPTVRPDDSVFR